jgi:hypothetical protein
VVSADRASLSSVEREIERLAARWPDEYRLGYRFGCRRKADPPCDAAGYPKGFHKWPLDRHNAWWAGWSRGHQARQDIKNTSPARTPTLSADISQ